MDCGYTLEPPGGMFWIKNKKKLIPLYTPVLLYKNWFKRGYILHGHVIMIYSVLLLLLLLIGDSDGLVVEPHTQDQDVVGSKSTCVELFHHDNMSM